MKVAQLSPTQGEYCGIALFADRLAAALAPLGVRVSTSRKLAADSDANVVLLQHHAELVRDDEVRSLRARAGRPVVLFAHSTGIAGVVHAVDGVMAMSRGMVPETGVPTLVFPHPAFTPERLSDRGAIRARLGLPVEARIVGSCGFLKFERQLTQILPAILPAAAEWGWFVQLVTSPWYRESPGLLEEIAALAGRHPGRVRHEHAHLSEAELNLRLQACDLLWCWTRAASSAYASGVASDLYASGSRMVVADKLQHEHVLGFPNVVRAPATLSGCVDELLRQMRHSRGERHDPAPVSWAVQAGAVQRFLAGRVRAFRRSA